MKNKFWIFTRIVIGIVLFLFVYFKIGIAGIISTFSRTNLIFFVPALLILAASFFVAAFNIKILTDKINNVRFLLILRYYLISWSIGLLAPGKIGEFSIAYFLKKHRFSIGQSIAISLFDKIITVICLGVISIFGIFIFLSRTSAIYLLFVSVFLFLLFVLLISSRRVRQIIRKYILRRHEKKFKGFYALLKKLFCNPNLLFINVFLTLVKWGLGALFVLFIFNSFGTSPGFLEIFIISSIIVIVSLIPISISGLGTREVTAVYLFSRLGIGSEITAAVYLLINFLNYIMAGCFIIFLK